MIWIDLLLMHYERQVFAIVAVLLILLNLSNLYFIIILMDYDEMVGYQPDGGLKISDPKNIVCTMLITMLVNLLYVFTTLFSSLIKKM